jgi:hypothetical protein
MRSTQKQALATLVVSAVLSFAVLYAGIAKANIIYTVPGMACVPNGTDGRKCPIAGGAPIAKGLSAVYFDFKSIGVNKVITSVVWRLTWSGTLHLANDGEILSAGTHETVVDCTPLNPNRSGWDYWFAGVSGPDAGLGTGSNVFGIGVWALE